MIRFFLYSMHRTSLYVENLKREHLLLPNFTLHKPSFLFLPYIPLLPMRCGMCSLYCTFHIIPCYIMRPQRFCCCSQRTGIMSFIPLGFSALEVHSLELSRKSHVIFLPLTFSPHLSLHPNPDPYSPSSYHPSFTNFHFIFLSVRSNLLIPLLALYYDHFMQFIPLPPSLSTL